MRADRLVKDVQRKLDDTIGRNSVEKKRKILNEEKFFASHCKEIPF